MLDDDDFEQARIESSTTLTISKFVDVGSIDPIFFDTAYYVAPDGAAGRDVFVVLREAIRKSRTAALSRIVVARRERAVAIIPSGTGLVCHTLHEQDDLWNAAPLFEDLDDVKPEADMVALATQLIERQNGRFQPDDTADRYEAKLREVIDAKLKGEGITPEQSSEPNRGNVIDLMAALKASLGQQNARASKKRATRQRHPDAGRRDGHIVTQPGSAALVAGQTLKEYGIWQTWPAEGLLFWQQTVWNRWN
jgi:DNA end-binding protein Ku